MIALTLYFRGGRKVRTLPADEAGIVVGNAHPLSCEGLGRDSTTETILFADEAEKGEKCMEVFDLESKATVLSDP